MRFTLAALAATPCLLPCLLLGNVSSGRAPAATSHTATSRVAPRDADEEARRAAVAHWKDVATALRKEHGVGTSLPLDARDIAALAKLDQKLLDGIDFEDEESLGAITRVLSEQLGVPILVDPEVEESVQDEGVAFNLALTSPRPARAVLDRLLRLSGVGARWRVDGGRVRISVGPLRDGEMTLHAHPAMDLLGTFQIDDLAVMIQDNVHPGSWEQEGVGIDPSTGFLFLRHDRDTQLEAETFLTRLVEVVEALESPPTFDPTEEEVRWRARMAELESMTIIPDFPAEGVSLPEFAKLLGASANAVVQIDRMVEDELDVDDLRISLPMAPISVRSALDAMALQQPELNWSDVDGFTIIHLDFQILYGPSGNVVTEYYDAREILARPEVPLPNTYGLQALEDCEEILLGPAALEEFVRNACAPASWDQDPNFSIRVTETGLLIVTQTAEHQAQIREMVKKLHAVAQTIKTASPK